MLQAFKRRIHVLGLISELTEYCIALGYSVSFISTMQEVIKIA